MKKYIISILSILPFLAMGQNWVEGDKLSVGLQTGTVYDIDFSRLDKDHWSSDLSSNWGDPARFAYLLSLNYQATPSLMVSANVGKGKIFGANEIMTYNGKFDQYNISTQLNIFSYKEVTLYGRLGVGVISYTASRAFLHDGITYLEESGESLKSNLALGIQHAYNERWTVFADASYDRVNTDGFDSWDDGLGNDKYLHTSVGLRYTLGKTKKQEATKSMASVPVQNDCKEKCEEVERKLAKLEAQLKALEAAAHTHEEEAAIEEVKDFKAAKVITEKLKKRLFFQVDKYNINVTALPELQELADFMQKYPQWKALVVGYTDADADDAYNKELSRKRAQTVIDALTGMGVEANRLRMDYKGENAPFVPNDNAQNKQLNRRVEITIEK